MNTFQLNGIRQLQENSMGDLCRIDTYSETSDSYKSLVKSWTSGSSSGSSICGYKSNMGSKSYGESETRLKYSAILRLPLNTTITTNDKVSIVSISGSALSNPIQFQVSSIETGHQILIVGLESTKV